MSRDILCGYPGERTYKRMNYEGTYQDSRYYYYYHHPYGSYNPCYSDHLQWEGSSYTVGSKEEDELPERRMPRKRKESIVEREGFMGNCIGNERAVGKMDVNIDGNVRKQTNMGYVYGYIGKEGYYNECSVKGEKARQLGIMPDNNCIEGDLYAVNVKKESDYDQRFANGINISKETNHDPGSIFKDKGEKGMKRHVNNETHWDDGKGGIYTLKNSNGCMLGTGKSKSKIEADSVIRDSNFNVSVDKDINVVELQVEDCTVVTADEKKNNLEGGLQSDHLNIVTNREMTGIMLCSDMLVDLDDCSDLINGKVFDCCVKIEMSESIGSRRRNNREGQLNENIENRETGDIAVKSEKEKDRITIDKYNELVQSLLKHNTDDNPFSYFNT